MELRTFIMQSLVDIQLGVQDAIDRREELGLKGAVNPIWGSPDKHDPAYVRDVVFDIAVTVSDTSIGKGGAGINVLSLKLGGEVSESAENSHVSRIQFSIPLIPPVTVIHPS